MRFLEAVAPDGTVLKRETAKRYAFAVLALWKGRWQARSWHTTYKLAATSSGAARATQGRTTRRWYA